MHAFRVVRFDAVGIVATAALELSPLVLEEDRQDMLYATESSVVEAASLLLWVVAAGVIPWVLGLTKRTVAASIVCLAAAAREADWHNAFTGYSVLKFGFYHRDESSLGQQLLAGAIVGTVIVCAVIVALALVHRVRAGAGFGATWVRILLVAVGVVVVSKVLDRTPNVSEEFGVVMPELLRSLMRAFEETMELFLPVLIIAAAMTFARGRAAERQRADQPRLSAREACGTLD